MSGYQLRYTGRGQRDVYAGGRKIASLARGSEGWNVRMTAGVSSVTAAGPFGKHEAAEFAAAVGERAS